ncbi:MAG TPA: HAD family hydrolase [Thermoanaerobaculia bacterium]|nr:HAD family hydrolase [Thermoanaerobaculia bacterium]
MPLEAVPTGASEPLRDPESDPSSVRIELSTWGAVRNPALLESRVGAVEGVATVAASPVSSRVQIDYREDVPESLLASLDAIRGCGYDQELSSHAGDAERPSLSLQLLVTLGSTLLFLVAAIATFPSLMTGMRFDLGPWTLRAGPVIGIIDSWLPLIQRATARELTTVVVLTAIVAVLLSGWSSLRLAVETARKRVLDDDTLVALAMLACLAALGYLYWRNSPVTLVTGLEISFAVALLRLAGLRQTMIRLRAWKRRRAASNDENEGALSRLGSALQKKSLLELRVQRVTRYLPHVTLVVALVSASVQWILTHSPVSALLGFAAVAMTVSSSLLLLAVATPGANALTDAFSRGVVLASSLALFRLSRIRTAILARRGVVLEPVPTVSDFVLLAGCTQQELLSNASSLAAESSHPVPVAVAARAASGITPHSAADVSTTHSRGISGSVGGMRVVLGQASWMEELGADLSPMREELDRYSQEGKSVAVVTRENIPLGAIALHEREIAGSHAAIRELERLGVASLLVSEADSRAVAHLATSLGITSRSGSPSATSTKEDGETAAVSYAASPGTPGTLRVVIEDRPSVPLPAADLVIRSQGLTGLVLAVKLAKAATRTSRRNLTLWIIFTLLSIIAASGAAIPLVGDWTWLAISSLLAMVGSLTIRPRVSP